MGLSLITALHSITVIHNNMTNEKENIITFITLSLLSIHHCITLQNHVYQTVP